MSVVRAHVGEPFKKRHRVVFAPAETYLKTESKSPSAKNRYFRYASVTLAGYGELKKSSKNGLTMRVGSLFVNHYLGRQIIKTESKNKCGLGMV